MSRTLGIIIHMDKVIKVLKIVFLSIGVLVGLAILVGIFFIYQGIKSGDLSGYIQKTAVENVIDEDSLSPTQQQLLESGDIDGLVGDLQENVTDEQVDCAVQAVGEKRARELMVTQDPSPQELLILSKCL